MADTQAVQTSDTANDDTNEVVVDSGSGEAQTETPEVESGKASEVVAKDADDNQVKSLRREAANYRTQAREHREKAEKLEADLAAMQAEMGAKDLELARERIGSELGIPAALRSRLTGATEEEIKADAESLATLVVPPKQSLGDPSGGLDSSKPASKSVSDLAAMARAARY